MFDFLANLDDGYLDIVDRLTGGGNYGYGATTLTAQVAYLLFLSRYYPPDGFRPMWDQYPKVALRMVEAANREAWDEAGGYYYKSSTEPEIYLMADGYMVYTLVEAYRYTGNPEHIDRARRVVAALAGMDRPVVWIAGGEGKDADFSHLRTVVAEHARAAVLMGRDAALIERALGGAVPVYRADDMHDAVRQAQGLAQSGDAVLLSPACASFDMFRNYEHRGEVFAEAVRDRVQP